MPPSSLRTSPPHLRVYLEEQISRFAFPVRFLSPEEAFLIAGILPYDCPTSLAWELAGNACSPFLLFDALYLISPPQVQARFPVHDMLRAWRRRLGHPLPLSPSGVFPGPINTVVFIFLDCSCRPLRTPEDSSLYSLTEWAAQLHGVDSDVYYLAFRGTRRLPPSSFTAGDLFGRHMDLVDITVSPASSPWEKKSNKIQR